MVNDENLEKCDTEIQTYESTEELKCLQENEDGGILILTDINEKQINDPWIQALFKRSEHQNLSNFIISQDY